MDKQQIIERTKDYVKESLKGVEPGHDWFHIERVWKMAKEIAKDENCDIFLVEMGALLHDIDDFKFNDNDGTPVKTMTWLESLGLNNFDIERIAHIVENVSFKGSAEQEKMKTLEGMIVQDADRLDALGAIGVSRAFTFAGAKKMTIYDPSIKPREEMKFLEYKKTDNRPAINHFYEKLFLLKDRMNTKTGKKLAEQRHKFMQTYLEQFFKEWNGER